MLEQSVVIEPVETVVEIESEITIVEIEPLYYEVDISAVGERGPANTTPGPTGPTGPQGPPGVAGAGAASLFIQNTPVTQWTITHTLGFNPAVSIVNSGGVRVYGDIQYVDVTTILATFTSPFSGIAYLS